LFGVRFVRKIFGKFIYDIALSDPKVVLIVGDIGFGIFDDYRRVFSDRFFNLGICEQSIIGVSSGMALNGFKPWVYTITPFLIERTFEQIKLDIDQQNVNVKLVGFADYPKLGPTHTPLDINHTMKVFKNINCFYPTNQDSTIQNLKEMYLKNLPCFVSLKSIN